MNITTVGMDLAKDIITVYAADGAGRVVEVRDLRRKDCSVWLVQLPEGCVVGMEACSGAHYWARLMRGLGLSPKIMAAEFVKPFHKKLLEQERPQRRRSHLHSCSSAQPALRERKERGTTDAASLAPSSRGVQGRTHCVDQSNPRPACGIRPGDRAQQQRV
jgi:transposase